MPKALWLQDARDSINLLWSVFASRHKLMINDFCHFLTGRHPAGMTKTQRAFIINLEKFYNSRKRPPAGWSRAPSPPRVRVSLSVVLGQCILESSVTQIPLHLTTKTHTLRVRATPCHHDEWLLLFKTDSAKHNQRLLCMGFAKFYLGRADSTALM